jgi:putative DNA primase/helicase
MNNRHSLSIDERAERELALVQRTAPSVGPAKAVMDESPHAILIRASDVQPEAVNWLWKGWLAASMLHLIGGSPGTGKTTIAVSLAATISSGGAWPDGTCAKAGRVVIWSGEDDYRVTLVPRLRAAGADMRQVILVNGIRQRGERFPFDPARDMDALRSALANVSGIRLIVIDPIVSAVSKDSHNNGDVRRGLQPLVDLGIQMGTAVLGITHFSKGTQGRDPLERVTGSLAFGALARLVMVTGKQEADDDRPERRFLLRAKSNVGPDGGGFVYDLQQRELPDYPDISASLVVWGEAIHGTARELLAEAETPDSERDMAKDAVEFLRTSLQLGPRSAEDLKREAKAAGIGWRTIERHKKRAGVASRKKGMGTGWEWYRVGSAICDTTKAAEETHSQSVAVLGGLRGDIATVVADDPERESFTL